MNLKKRLYLKLVIFLAIVTVLNLSLVAQTFDAVKSRVKVHILKSGMKFIVLEHHEAPVVSFHVYADVGSANESYGIR